MTPYADWLYFGILLYIAAPSVLSGFVGRLRLSKLWIVLATAIMLTIQYWTPQVVGPGTAVYELGLVAGYALTEWIIASGFLLIRRQGKSSPAYYAALFLTLLPLIVVKLTPLLTPSFLVGFLGISYITFRGLDVIINIQDGLIAELPIVQYLAFLLFFPTISSGPIDRYRRFAADWNHQRTRAEFLQDLDGAVQRIFKGLLYKFILAALIKQYWMDPVSHGAQAADILSYMYAYSLYLFFDFAGYSAFAIGLSYLLGIHAPENFNRPFLARDIRDFWNRWHISLSWWFRDHIYTRFVFTATKNKWFKNKYIASYLGFFLTMGLMGLWHGTTWYYILYGLYHGALLTGHDKLSRWNKQKKLWGQGVVSQAVSILVTFNLVCFGLLLFSGRLSADALAPAQVPQVAAATRILARVPQLNHVINIHYGDQFTLTGYAIGPSEKLQGGMTVSFSTGWRADKASDDPYQIVTRVIDAQGHVWAKDVHTTGARLAPTAWLMVGKQQYDWCALRLPPTLPAGIYQITVGVRTMMGDSYLQAQDDAGNSPGTDTPVASVWIEKNKSSVLASELLMWGIDHPLYVDMREMRFLGTTALPPSLLHGEMFHLGIYWRARAKPRGDYLVAVRLRNADGQIAFEQSARPANDTYPTTLWDAGEVLLDWHDFSLPAMVLPGRYLVQVALLDSATGEDLGEVAVGQVTVQGK